MRLAPLLETPLGTQLLPLELESQLMLKLLLIQDMLSIFNFLLLQRLTLALTLIKLLLLMSLALLQEILPGTPKPHQELETQLMLKLLLIQDIPFTSKCWMKVILSQRPTSALTPTRLPPRMRLAPPPETLHGTLSPPPELESQLTLKLLLIQDMLSIFNSVLMVTPSQRLISAPTPTKPPPRMRHAPLLETPLGTPSLPLELESQLMLKPTHTQDILSTEWIQKMETFLNRVKKNDPDSFNSIYLRSR
jgi:hypothetical protein